MSNQKVIHLLVNKTFMDICNKIILNNGSNFFDLLENIKPLCNLGEEIIIEGSFAKYIYDSALGNPTRPVGDIDIHIDTTPAGFGNDTLYNKLRPIIGDHVRSNIKDTIICKIDVKEYIGTDNLFRDINKADIELMILKVFQSNYSVQGIPKIKIAYGGIQFEHVFDNEQYNGIYSDFNIFLPWYEINPKFNYVKQIDSNTIKFYHDEMPQFIKAFLLIFYNKVVKTNLSLSDIFNIDFTFYTYFDRMTCKYPHFFQTFILQDITLKKGRRIFLEGIYNGLFEYYNSKNDMRIIILFILVIIVGGIVGLINMNKPIIDVSHINGLTNIEQQYINFDLLMTPNPNRDDIYYRGNICINKIISHVSRNNSEKAIKYTIMLYNILQSYIDHGKFDIQYSQFSR